MIAVEVRSSGWGPRAGYYAVIHRRFWRMALIASGVIFKRWCRMGVRRSGHIGLVADGVAIIIRRET